MTTTAMGLERPPSRVGNWALKKIGLDEARRTLDASRVSGEPRTIAVIDSGSGALNHPLFKRTGLEYISPHEIARRGGLPIPTRGESEGSHAAEVAGVIAIACPEARIIVYNVATSAGVERELFVAALHDICNDPKPCVANISLGWLDKARVVDEAIKDCVDAGIVVVAAMGELEEPSDFVSYPAACEGAIAVGATDRFDLRVQGSSIGEHIWIGAPGEDIDTVVSETDVGIKSGTSFAAALVSVAAWLGLRAFPSATPDEMKRRLGESANSERVDKVVPARTDVPSGRWNMAIGCGRLNVAKLIP